MIRHTKIFQKDLTFVEKQQKAKETNTDTIERLFKELRKSRRK